MEPLSRPTGGDQDRGPVLLAMWWTELSISIIMVMMRMSSRFKLKSVGVDDWFMVAALVIRLAQLFLEFKSLMDILLDLVHFHYNCGDLRYHTRRGTAFVLFRPSTDRVRDQSDLD